MDTLHVLVILAAVSAGRTCSPEGYRKIYMDEMAFEADIIAYGLVTKQFPHQGEEYSAEFDVKCSYKGGALPSKLNISNAGYAPGMCGYKNFTVGMEYIAFLSYYGGKYSQIYDDTMMAEESMTQLLSFCGLQMDYPSDDSNSGQCQDVQQSGCQPFRPAPTPLRPEGNQPPPPPFQPGSNPPPLFQDPEGSGEVSSQMETSSIKSEMRYSESGMTSFMPDMTSEKMKETSKTNPPTSSSTGSVVKNTEVIIVPIVTPEKSGQDKDDEESNYDAMNNSSVTNISFTVSLSALVMFWTLN